ncbi:Imm53 family immunity protein [Streptomyces venezuelae]|uniref:Rhodanese-related sulfurtransferase n=1 Tax=Streptomyces venezuelae TaxID=54571 RepID=A0A5P2B4Z9_STRVZ|nr:Imm53 family immunity protein [Streptomyces venezuelae]QES25565.1 rhodanese-related sulfurtransferase [Streptomyces venezuelae]
MMDFLQSWYRSQCDGDWKHEFGIRIETLDNPGWNIEIDLTGTDVEGRTLPKTDMWKSPGGRWLWLSSDGQKFTASCDSISMDHAILRFKELMEGDGKGAGFVGS